MDIKPDNLLLDKDLNIKISDFGLCGIQQKDEQLFSDKVGTDAYQAPEVRAASKSNLYCGKKADVFSLGVTLFAMLKGYPPFSRATASDPFFKKIEEGDWESFFKLHFLTDKN